MPIESGPEPASGLWSRIRKYVEGLLEETPARRCAIMCDISVGGHLSSLLLILWLARLDGGAHFSQQGLNVVYILSVAVIALWALLAVAARRVTEGTRSAWALQIVFTHAWAFTYAFLLYWSGLYSSPYWMFLAAAGTAALALHDQRLVASAIFLSFAGLIAAGFAMEAGLIPYAPLFHTFPVDASGHAAPAWRYAFVGIAIGFMAPCWIFSAVMYRRWYEREGEFRDLATKDGLTGLFNRRHFLELFEAEFERARRYGRPLSFAVLDVDYFKRINDQYGHLIGDRVLMTIASVLNSAVRTTDVIARYGGEEFVLLLPETGLEAAEAVAERCRQSVETTQIVVGGHTSFHVTVSLGLVRFPVAGASSDAAPVERVDDLIRLADEALYKAKAAGRNRIILAGSQGEGI